MPEHTSEVREPGELRQELRQWLRLPDPSGRSGLEIVRTDELAGFERNLISYTGLDGDTIPAYLLVPKGLDGPAPAVVVHHQHNGERHLGKSEVCGLAGNPIQAFGPALAECGLVVLAPDSICFEDRRATASGTEPHEADWLQHYNEMCYRLLRGDTLMRKVLEDAELGISVLAGLEEVDSTRIGVVGHSYGGNTALFQGALDVRANFICSSGAVCSYRDKMRRGTGIEMAEVLPGALGRFEVGDLLHLMASRQALVVSATEDKYSGDAAELVQRAAAAFSAAGGTMEHLRYEGGHELTRSRVHDIVQWAVKASNALRRVGG